MFSFRRRRDKVFGPAPAEPLDRNGRARILHQAHAYNARWRRKGQHWGPLTRATVEVLRVLLYRFQNDKTGQCFPGYDRIAAAARCHRDTVNEAIKALEIAGLLTWVHRLARVRISEQGLLGPVLRWQVIRTSNGYRFVDPSPRPACKTENPPGHENQDLNKGGPALLDLPIELAAALEGLGHAIDVRDGAR